MIQWPDDETLTREARAGVRRFRETAAASELEAAPDRWVVVAWPWTTESPLHVVLENEARRTLSVTMTSDGIWMMKDDPRAYHLRSVEALERDALGVPPSGDA